jgi:hypothetical protein
VISRSNPTPRQGSEASLTEQVSSGEKILPFYYAKQMIITFLPDEVKEDNGLHDGVAHRFNLTTQVCSKGCLLSDLRAIYNHMKSETISDFRWFSECPKRLKS